MTPLELFRELYGLIVAECRAAGIPLCRDRGPSPWSPDPAGPDIAPGYEWYREMSTP